VSTEPERALSCLACLSVVVDEDAEDFAECTECGSDATEVVTVTECPDPETCDDADHHYGLNKHVSEPER